MFGGGGGGLPMLTTAEKIRTFLTYSCTTARHMFVSYMSLSPPPPAPFTREMPPWTNEL